MRPLWRKPFKLHQNVKPKFIGSYSHSRIWVFLTETAKSQFVSKPGTGRFDSRRWWTVLPLIPSRVPHVRDKQQIRAAAQRLRVRVKDVTRSLRSQSASPT